MSVSAGSFTLNNEPGATVTKSSTGVSRFTGASSSNNNGTMDCLSWNPATGERQDSLSGTYNVANSTNLQFMSGARNLNAGSDITGSGNVQLGEMRSTSTVAWASGLPGQWTVGLVPSISMFH